MALDKSDPFTELPARKEIGDGEREAEKRPYEWLTPGADHPDVLERLLTRIRGKYVRLAIRGAREAGHWRQVVGLLPPKGEMEERVRGAILEVVKVLAAGGDPNAMETVNKGGRPAVVGEPWVALGISRKTWYNRKKAGLL